jgi:hypothetical protein
VIEGSFENDDEDFEEIYDSDNDNDNILSDLDLMI